ncbi:MAG: hypothetical protein HQK54_05000 [Oligoflexales bacterium]|nr:hypothetical protein [Oligoflexales bacterium]
MKNRTIYWLTSKTSPLHESKAQLLKQVGFDLTFFKSFKTMVEEFNKKRVGVIIIGDEENPNEIEDIFNQLEVRAEMNGVRLILSLSSRNPLISNLAYHNGFRDIIPLDLDNQTWLSRLIFSTGTENSKFMHPIPQLSLRNITGISVPARIIWISGTQMRIETKISPPIGQKLQITGNIATNLGVKALTVTVQERVKTDLVFRFSEAFICDLDVPNSREKKQSILMEHLKKEDIGRIHRIFVIVKSTGLRSELLSRLSSDKFNVITAFNQKNIVNEPRFFNPDIVFVEDVMCQLQDYKLIENMAENLQPGTPIIVIGQNADFNRLRETLTRHKIALLTQIKENLANTIINKYLSDQIDETAMDGSSRPVFIKKSSLFSRAEISFTSRLTRVHPLSVQIALPLPLGNYGLCRIDSPLLKKSLDHDIFAKITDSYKDNSNTIDNYKFLIDCSTCNLLEEDRSILAGKLAEYLISGIKAAKPIPLKAPIKEPSKEEIKPHTSKGIDLLDEVKIKNEAISAKVKAEVKVETAAVRKKREPPYRSRSASAAIKGMREFLIFMTISLIAIAALYLGFKYLERSYEKSGKDYSEQLKMFKKDFQNEDNEKNEGQ